MVARRQQLVIAISVAVLLLAAGASITWANTSAPRTESAAQAGATATPVQLQFPTATTTAGPPSETPTRTPTSQGGPWVEALADNTNLRSGPDITNVEVGEIFPGATYPIVGKRFQWYWIEYPEIAGGRAWVHESVVTVGGDETQIQQLEELPEEDPTVIVQQETALAITQTPGLAETMTAQALVTPTGLFTPQPGQQAATRAPGEPLPTFTPPIVTPTAPVIPRDNPPQASETGLAPILPILVLGALGLMGLLVSILRRM